MLFIARRPADESSWLDAPYAYSDRASMDGTPEGGGGVLGLPLVVVRVDAVVAAVAAAAAAAAVTPAADAAARSPGHSITTARSCGLLGHINAFCPSRTYIRCREPGHCSNVCTVAVCHRCKEIRHYGRDCTKPRPKCGKCGCPHKTETCRVDQNRSPPWRGRTFSSSRKTGAKREQQPSQQPHLPTITMTKLWWQHARAVSSGWPDSARSSLTSWQKSS